MKYLVVYSGDGNEEKTLCANETEAIELVEGQLRDGCAEADFEVYTAEPISFGVERIPVVTLSKDVVEADDVEADTSQPDASDFPSASFSSYTDNKGEDANPFSTEQVFSLDS